MTTVTPIESFLEKAAGLIPGGVNTSQRRVDPALVPVTAAGAYFEDASGQRYLDFHCAFGPIVLGHCYPTVNRRVKEAIDSIDLLGAGITPLEIQLAEKIAQHVPCAERVLLCNSGTEATYHAIRLSRAVTGRRKLVKFQGCYHGAHDAVLMNIITPLEKLGQKDVATAGATAQLIDDTLICDFNSLDSVEAAIKAHPGDVAAIILEPIPHNVGCLMPQPGFLQGLREIADANGIVLIFDEVITGFRHSLGGYQKIAGVTPDLTTMAKAMANGFPIAAVAGRSHLMDQFNTHPAGKVFFSGTYNAHAVGVSAALATIDALESPQAHAHLFSLGDRVRKGLNEITARLGIPAITTGFGSVFVTYFRETEPTTYVELMRQDHDKFVAFRQGMIRRGFYQLPVSVKRNHLTLSHTVSDVDRTLEASEDVLRRMMA
ncbi:MAG: aspartate aminotransferase family protein [Bryobacterales bacterium]|nr:aspartate aminotransferase family protein [Bryobacterales bacterium]